MSRQVFIMLPVADLQKSSDFFAALGLARNAKFSDEVTTCVVVSDSVSVMLVTQARFGEFTPKAICDTSRVIEVLVTLGCDSREQVDSLVAKALAAGGSTYDEPEDFGFMYTHSFVDLDGHGWGLACFREASAA